MISHKLISLRRRASHSPELVCHSSVIKMCSKAFGSGLQDLLCGILASDEILDRNIILSNIINLTFSAYTISDTTANQQYNKTLKWESDFLLVDHVMSKQLSVRTSRPGNCVRCAHFIETERPQGKVGIQPTSLHNEFVRFKNGTLTCVSSPFYKI